MSLNGLPVVARPAQARTAPAGTPISVPLSGQKHGKNFVNDSDRERGGQRRNGGRRGGGGLADAIYKSLRQLGLGAGISAASATNDDLNIQRGANMGHLMQTLFQSVQAHSPALANGHASSFAAGLACVTAQLAEDDSLGLALERVLLDLHKAQPGSAKTTAAPPKPLDLLIALQRNLSVQTKAVHAMGNVVNSRA